MGKNNHPGIICPSCSSKKLRVLDTRKMKVGIYRRRECLECKIRFRTVEKYEKYYRYAIKSCTHDPIEQRRIICRRCKAKLKPVTTFEVG